ncbi:hypothetical protein ES708_18486 [subsurface metagenome]
MGDFVKGRCPCCGWQLSPKVWRRQLADSRLVGLLFHSTGRNGIAAASPLSSPDELSKWDSGLFSVMVGRVLDVVRNWVRWRWLPVEDVLNMLPIHYLGGGMWVRDYERVGKAAKGRAAAEYAMVNGGSITLFKREVSPVIERGSKDYGW